ncbi:hypothetical protein [Poriferisphaera sp. WC338]|uniref:hypothetical protein n=1 Tax=Poriferisphaera sp. WC338 TaxID=3425129 RepID=UPI003D81557F
MKNSMMIVTVLVMGSLLVGCASRQEKRLLAGSSLVGAGYDVKFRAPTDGVVYYYDQKSKRILATHSLNKDELFDASADMYSSKLKMLLGKKASKARLHLYWKASVPHGTYYRYQY